MNRALYRSVPLALTLLLTAWGSVGAAQESAQPQAAPQSEARGERFGREGGRQGREGEGRAFGIVSSVGVDRIEIKKMDGSTETVLVNDQTHYRQQQKEIQLEDIKVGDHVFVGGQANDKKELVAAMVRRVTDEEIQRFQGGGERAFGEVVSIDQGQIKIRNPRQGEKTVVVNDQTQIVKEGQPITLKDLKVGDRIFALGKEANGQFVATRVMTGQFRRGQEGGHRYPPGPNQ